MPGNFTFPGRFNNSDEKIMASKKNDFEQIDISQFFNEPNFDVDSTEEFSVLTPKEKLLYDELLGYVKEKEPDRIPILENRIKDLNLLSKAISRFPSLLEKHDITGGIRTPQLLIESLIKHQNMGDTTLQLPSKATLGKGYIASKIHTFSSLTNISKRVEAPEKLTDALQLETITMMFTLMAEDVYLNLINDQEQPMEYRREWAMSLLLLWEYRNDQTTESAAPILQSVWNARRKLAPAFGTLMGTSELLLMSIQMDEQWIQFIKQKMGDPNVAQAMEEFLFGISYEQILHLRTILKTKGIPAISRDEVSSFLGERIKADAGLGYRDFYALYTVRRDNARARARMKLEGPHQTLEDYFIKFVTELNKEKQSNDTFAK